MNEEAKLYYKETEKTLNSGNKNYIMARLKELRKTGNATLLPLVLELFTRDSDEDILLQVLELLSELRDQKCTGAIAHFIDANPGNKYLSRLIGTCWQTQLDYSKYLGTFINSFITGDYQTAIESFTVIEESLWRTPPEKIKTCLDELSDKASGISAEKRALYDQLADILKEGRSANRDEYLDI